MLNAICRGLFVLSDLKRVRFVDIGEIVDNRCLNFLIDSLSFKKPNAIAKMNDNIMTNSTNEGSLRMHASTC
jgi:hypothetical protein